MFYLFLYLIAVTSVWFLTSEMLVNWYSLRVNYCFRMLSCKVNICIINEHDKMENVHISTRQLLTYILML